MSNYPNGLSVQATPTRDRHAFPLSAQPSPAPSLRQASTSNSTNLTSSSSSVSTQAITVDSLLKQFSSSSDPKAAALNQAVADRNVLSAQNAQLWKLIEKQRTGYNQILKELERIRGERDAYKNRLVSLNGGTVNGLLDARQKTTSERGPRPSLDTTSSTTSISSTSPMHIRQPIIRQYSEDNATPKNLDYPQLHSSRSFEPLPGSMSDISSTRTGSPLPAPPASTPTPHSNRQGKLAPSPLVVENRSDTLSSLDPLAISTSYKLSSSRDTNMTPANHVGNGNHISSAHPILAPRKSSVADSVNSILTTGSSISSTSSQASAVPPVLNHNVFGNHSGTPSSPQYFLATPQTVPPGGSSSQGTENGTHRQKNISTSISPVSSLQQPASTMTLNDTSLTNQQPNSNSQMLSPNVDTRPHMLSRDSRISLPDEARQYIANMSDSPVPSPRTESFSPRSKLATSIFPPPSDSLNKSGSESEFLDMEEESDEESEGEEQGDTTANAGDPTFDSLNAGSSLFNSKQTNNTNDRFGYKYPPPELPNNYSSNSSDIDGKKRDKSRVSAEEFPLPPPSNIFIQRMPTQDSQLYDQNPQSAISQVQQHSAPPQAMGDLNSQPAAGHSSHDSLTPVTDNAHISQQALPPRSDSNSQQQQSQKHETVTPNIATSFRALPLLSSDLPHTTITVSHSFVRPNDRGKEVLSFVITVNPGNGKDIWKVEKMYSDVLSLDQRVRNSVGKGIGKRIANLPEGKLWKDHAPAKVDQRKAVLENYLQTLIHLPVKNNDEVIAFFTSDIVREQKMPVMQAGHKEGYLTKRGKNFGGWKTRFFVLQGPVLEYYDCRGGAHLGSITITGAQIARQHRTERAPSNDDEKEYRHAFLIVEAKKGPGGNHPRHVLCAESDEDRDSWVEMLVRYYTGTYSEDFVFNPTSGTTSIQNSHPAVSQFSSAGMGQPRSSTSSTDISTASTPRKSVQRGLSRDDPSKGSAMPVSLMPPDTSSGKLFQSVPTSEDYTRSSSPSRSIDPSPIDKRGPSAAGGVDIQKKQMDYKSGLPSSLPDSSPLSSNQSFQTDPPASGQRANSELGHYSDLLPGKNPRQRSPEQHRTRDDSRKSLYPSLNPVSSSPTVIAPPERVPSPEKLDGGKVKISGPMNGVPIPSGFNFGKESPSSSSNAVNDRREKAKSRSFWGFSSKGDKSQPNPAHPPRAVFGVPLEEALDVAQICNLPAIVFRSIQYLEAKKADQEEGIYRLSGSSAVIKNLKDMFNNEGDVDLLMSDEYWDPHAIAGLLKSFLRELPSSILTRDLHLRFLAVIDFVDPQERIRELSQLIAALPLANYSLLRALTAHLILIVQNSNINKMTMRNVGIVFSPTLGIPAGVFSLMLGEFNRVFNVDADNDEVPPQGASEVSTEPLRRNSRQYSDAAADRVLGLAGRTLKTSGEEAPSDGDDFSIQDDSGTEMTEGEVTVGSSSSSSLVSAPGQDTNMRLEMPNTPTAKTSKASITASSRGLNVAVTHSDRGNRHSRLMGLPLSPRPNQHSPSQPDIPPNSYPTSTRPNE